MARKSGIERDGREIGTTVENGVQSVSKALVQNVVVDRRTDHLAKDVTQMKGRQVRDLCELCYIPFVGWCERDGLLHALKGTHPPD